MECSAAEKKQREIPSIPSPASDLWEVIKILRRYHAAGTHRYAGEVWKIVLFFSNCLGDWMRKMKGTIEARVTLRRIVMTIVIDIVIANQDVSFVLGLIRLGKIYNRNR